MSSYDFEDDVTTAQSVATDPTGFSSSSSSDGGGSGDADFADGQQFSPVRPLQPEGSILDVFRQEQQELVNTRDVFIPVKGYERSGLQVKYRMPENGKVLGSIASRIQRTERDRYQQNLLVAIDTMIALCDGIYVQPEGVEEPVMFDPQELGEACKFDERLADNIGVKAKSAREVVLALFGNKELIVLSHSEKLSRWLQNSKAETDSEYWLGE